MLPELTRHDVACALDEVVAALMFDADIAGPPIDAIELASRLSMTVTESDKQAERARLSAQADNGMPKRAG